MNHRVIIVGAGVIGCAIARELSVRGVRCTVIDPRPIAGGATQASAGMLAPYVEAHDRGPMLDLCVRSLNLYDDWIGALRADGNEIAYARNGTLEIALTVEQARALKSGDGDWLDGDAVAAAVPQLAPSVGALRNLRHGHVDARELGAALAASAERHGATFVSARVERIDRRGETLRVRIGAGSADTLDASTVILAAGAWTNLIHGIAAPPLRPVRGQLLHVRWGHGRLRPILWGPDCYIVPLREAVGGLLIGATVEEVGFDERTTEEGVRGLFGAAQRLLPVLRDEDMIEARVGLRPATPDALPVLGADPEIPGLIHASGHYRNGVLLAPITGQLIADLVVGEPADPALQHFRPGRF